MLPPTHGELRWWMPFSLSADLQSTNRSEQWTVMGRSISEPSKLPTLRQWGCGGSVQHRRIHRLYVTFLFIYTRIHFRMLMATKGFLRHAFRGEVWSGFWSRPVNRGGKTAALFFPFIFSSRQSGKWPRKQIFAVWRGRNRSSGRYLASMEVNTCVFEWLSPASVTWLQEKPPRRRQNTSTLRGWLFQTNGHSTSLIGALGCTPPGSQPVIGPLRI